MEMGPPKPAAARVAALSGSATGNPRNKTALAPGCSLMDWIRLGSSGVDLTGVGGKILTISPAELAKHDKEDDAWIAIRGVVFNVTKYLKFHPGGVLELMRGVGRDATKLFDDVHAWVNYQSLLKKCVVGKLSGGTLTEGLLYPKIEKTKNESCQKVRLDWRQTSLNVTFFFIVNRNLDLIDECQIRKISDLEFSIRLNLVKSQQAETFRTKVFEDLEWPPNCQRNYESSEIQLLFKKRNKKIWTNYGSYMLNLEKLSEKREYNEFQVIKNINLNKLVHSLILRAQNFIQMVPPGKHLEVKGNIEGTEVSRMYTPVPCPDSSSECICLIVKYYDNGALSPILTRAEDGHVFSLSNALGNFRPENFDSQGTMHLLAAGSGLTVMLSIIDRALQKQSIPVINVYNFNKNEDNIFYDQKLQSLVNQNKIKITNILSEANKSWQGRHGFISKESLEVLLGKPTKEACVFTCGPPNFIKVAKNCLIDLGWTSKQMHEFDD